MVGFSSIFLLVNGLNEAKILKFGEEFVNVICSVSSNSKTSEKPSIQEILLQYPLPNAKPTDASAEITYSLFKTGKTIQQIATER